MADDNRLLALYGHGYEPAGPHGDPNSLGYALQGPAASFSTADDLRNMAAMRAAKEHEGPEALSRLIAIGLLPMARAPRVPLPNSEMPNPAVMARMRTSIYDRPLNDIDAVKDVRQPLPYPKYEYQFPEKGQPSYPANQDYPLTSAPPRNPGLLEQMAKEIETSNKAYWDNLLGGAKPTQAEFANPTAGRFDQAMRNGGKPPTVELNLPEGLAEMANQRYRDARQNKEPMGPLGPDRGVTGGTNPNKDSPYAVPYSAEALMRDYRSQIKGARSSNVVPFGVRRPANDALPVSPVRPKE